MSGSAKAYVAVRWLYQFDLVCMDVVQEKELSGMQNLLLEQDEDIRACQQRLGELESALLLACPPSSATSNNGECESRGAY